MQAKNIAEVWQHKIAVPLFDAASAAQEFYTNLGLH